MGGSSSKETTVSSPAPLQGNEPETTPQDGQTSGGVYEKNIQEAQQRVILEEMAHNLRDEFETEKQRWCDQKTQQLLDLENNKQARVEELITRLKAMQCSSALRNESYCAQQEAAVLKCYKDASGGKASDFLACSALVEAYSKCAKESVKELL
uniref:Uncharacterized protein n=1 Tax=Octactis speculum TaxID=3111310 RepID=A0A7S2GNJ5_9STRA|mmetsp:Transcript_54318/g.74212  ORF Transcript_54318/g.74212 Transcript_54318/m.74212 type:complete len:153 (+) Transcript_54318:47-505(+)|eukprot:CAMPEP_0185767342 /NCGR_PEP_ID=MMETSP1174-20130828/42297_1 /TAXON_ID=35687 /ORGANISM="Dictyocha speculum, Strain CCMP1381" /LENGTH=152 /DNA_ID=CAMNT_0028451467 /DNA_START=47 /DNA_END=505 /DNA_ORIENTATION=+